MWSFKMTDNFVSWKYFEGALYNLNLMLAAEKERFATQQPDPLAGTANDYAKGE